MAFISYTLLLSLLSVVFVSSATVGEKWEMPPLPQPNSYQTVYSSYGDPSGGTVTVMERQGSQPGTVTVIGQGSQSGAGPYPGPMAMERQGPPNSFSGNFGPPGPPGPPGSLGYPPNSGFFPKDPGFSVQTGFEGFLVPNPWFGLIPWGIEGVVIVVVGIIVFVLIPIAVIFTLFKFFKLGKLFKDDDGNLEEVRSYIPSYFNKANFNALTYHVYDALDKYNELIKMRQD